MVYNWGVKSKLDSNCLLALTMDDLKEKDLSLVTDEILIRLLIHVIEDFESY
jgi:hypothetical protein